MQFFTIVFFLLISLTVIAIKTTDKFLKTEKNKILSSNIILLVASYVFVIYADYRFALALALLTLSTWFFAKKDKYISIGVVIAISSLAFFKYTNFFIASFADLFGLNSVSLNIIVPIGVSFYTFSAVSYLVDIKRKKLEPVGFFELALYLSFFPKLTSGPIQRGKDFFKQANSRRVLNFDSFSVGIQIFVFGLFKKIVMADRLSVFVDQVYSTPNAFGSLTVFIAVVAYAFQIYFDFSGYSDMAIGIAKIIGFDMPRNFNLPYLSHNVTELWKRWHISLSSWLQEYLYISLGGSRKGKVRTYINLILTMVIGGIWHGANWTYILWGLFHGLALAVHKVWMLLTKSEQKEPSKIGIVFSTLLTFSFTCFCWIFFRANSFENAINVISRILAFERGLEQPYVWLFFALAVFGISVLFAVIRSDKKRADLKKKNQSVVEGYYPILDLHKFWHLVAFFVMIGLTLALAHTGGSPFIYGNY